MIPDIKNPEISIFKVIDQSTFDRQVYSLTYSSLYTSHTRHTRQKTKLSLSGSVLSSNPFHISSKSDISKFKMSEIDPNDRLLWRKNLRSNMMEPLLGEQKHVKRIK